MVILVMEVIGDGTSKDESLLGSFIVHEVTLSFV